jgi:hypothetical protein
LLNPFLSVTCGGPTARRCRAKRLEGAEREQQKNCARRADGRRLVGDDRRDYLKGCLDAAVTH